MTEAEWLAGDGIGPMIDFIEWEQSDRKLRLFAIAATRFYLGDQFPTEYGPRIVAAELIADGHAPLDPNSS